MLGVEPDELMWSCTDLERFLCRLENRKLRLGKIDGEPEGVVALDDELIEL